MQELHIKRKHGTHDVTVHITDEEVGVSVPFDEYMELLLAEIGNPATLMTREGLRKRFLEAAQRLDLNLKSDVKPWANIVKR